MISGQFCSRKIRARKSSRSVPIRGKHERFWRIRFPWFERRRGRFISISRASRSIQEKRCYESYEQTVNWRISLPDLCGGGGGVLVLAAHHIISKKKVFLNYTNRQSIDNYQSSRITSTKRSCYTPRRRSSPWDLCEGGGGVLVLTGNQLTNVSLLRWRLLWKEVVIHWSEEFACRTCAEEGMVYQY